MVSLLTTFLQCMLTSAQSISTNQLLLISIFNSKFLLIISIYISDGIVRVLITYYVPKHPRPIFCKTEEIQLERPEIRSPSENRYYGGWTLWPSTPLRSLLHDQISRRFPIWVWQTILNTPPVVMRDLETLAPACASTLLGCKKSHSAHPGKE